MTKQNKYALVASMVILSVHHLRTKAGLLGPVSFYSAWVGHHIICGVILWCASILNPGL